MICTVCGKFHDEKSKYCNYCGSDLSKGRGAKKKIRVTPSQRAYILIELKLKDLARRREKLSKRLNTPPQGVIGKLIGNSGEKITKMRLDSLDDRMTDLEEVYAILGGE